MVSKVEGSFTVSRLLSENTSAGSAVTPSGTSICFKAVQPVNMVLALYSPRGYFTLLNAVQFWNAA